MKKYWFNIFMIISLIFTSLTFYSCDDGGHIKDDGDTEEPWEDEPPISDMAETTVLLYAVATNSLESSLTSDMNEMLVAAKSIDLYQNNILIFKNAYEYLYNEETGRYVYSGKSKMSLERLTKSGSEYAWTTVKEYPNDIAALNPMMISEVVDYVYSTYPASYKGMIFWSHSSGSDPYLESRSSGLANVPSSASFGIDESVDDIKYQQINVDELADALPDGFFDFIWFDSCNMSNIESIYQLRNKSDYFVGYATEVYSPGMPYDLTLPYMVYPHNDLMAAAGTFFYYYDDYFYQQTGYRAATIAVVDQRKIESLADFCRSFYEPDTKVSFSSFIKYTRGSLGPFYDLGDYTKAMASALGRELTDDEWNEMLDDVVIYKAATPKKFDGLSVPPERYSGISTHIYFTGNFSAKDENFYQSLDWYKSIFPNP